MLEAKSRPTELDCMSSSKVSSPLCVAAEISELIGLQPCGIKSSDALNLTLHLRRSVCIGTLMSRNRITLSKVSVSDELLTTKSRAKTESHNEFHLLERMLV